MTGASQCTLFGVMSVTMPMVYANLSSFRDKVTQYPWLLVICCLLIRVIPDAGVASQCPMVGVMTVTIVKSRCLCKQETHSYF